MDEPDEPPVPLRVELHPPADVLHAELAPAFAAAGAELRRAHCRGEPDVVIALDGAPLPEPAVAGVLVLVDDASPDAVERLLQAGVLGVLERTAPADTVVRAAHAVARGYAVLPGRGAHLAPVLAAESRLTREERDWLQLLADGWRVGELAVTVGVGERELYRRLAGVYRRLGVTNRRDAIALHRAGHRHGAGTTDSTS